VADWPPATRSWPSTSTWAGRRASPLPAWVRAAVEELAAAQAQLPPPPDVGRVIAP
jgi:hypothetical protein